MNILHPMLGMIALSGLLILVLLASRLAPIIKYWGDLQFAEHSEDLRPQLPRPLRLITENYNHIFEQPTLFSQPAPIFTWQVRPMRFTSG